MFTISKSFGERPSGKNHHPVGLFSVVSKVFEKLQNNSLSPRQIRPFSDFQYGFRSSQSTADIVTVVFDRIDRALF